MPFYVCEFPKEGASFWNNCKLSLRHQGPAVHPGRRQEGRPHSIKNSKATTKLSESRSAFLITVDRPSETSRVVKCGALALRHHCLVQTPPPEYGSKVPASLSFPAWPIPKHRLITGPPSTCKQLLRHTSQLSYHIGILISTHRHSSLLWPVSSPGLRVL